MKFYEFSMTSGNTTTMAIVANPKFEGYGIMRATKVAYLDDISKDGKYSYHECDPVEFIAAGGPYTLEEYEWRR